MAKKDFNSMSPWGQMARCIVNPDTSVAYFLDKDNSNLKDDGSEVDWDEVEKLGQNVMVQIPKFYYVKKWIEEQQAYIFGVTNKPITNAFVNEDEWQIHPAFYRDITKLCDDQSAVPKLVNYRYYGAFHGWKDNKDRLRSLPGKLPTTNVTISDGRNLARNMGVGWSQLDYYLVYATQTLYITEYGHPDAQTQIGRGFVDGNRVKINTGGTLDKGNNTFGETTGKKQMSYRGIEDWWGNFYNWVDGVVADSDYNLLIGNKGFNSSGKGYDKIVTANDSSVSTGGTIRHIQKDIRAGFIVKDISGKNNNGGLYDGGGFYSNNDGFIGGSHTTCDSSGPFNYKISANHNADSTNINSRLCL